MQSRQTRELTQDEMSILMTLEMAPNADELFNELAANAGGWVLQAIEKRFAAHKTNADKKVMIMVLCLGDGVVGKCANYVDDIVDRAKALQVEIAWSVFVRQIYPHGIPVF